MRGVFGGSRHVGEEDVHWVAPPFVVLARAYAEVFELVKRPAVDVQEPGVLGDALEERGTLGELEVVKRRIQGRCAVDHAIEVQFAAEGEVPGLAGRAKGLLAFGEVDLRCVLVAEPFTPSHVVVVVSCPLRGSMPFGWSGGWKSVRVSVVSGRMEFHARVVSDKESTIE